MVLDPTALDARFVNEEDAYTDSDVEDVITAELVDGQSIDNAIDSLISTHTDDAEAHQIEFPHALNYYADLGASVWTSAFYGAMITLPSNDNDARIIYNIMVPPHWTHSTCYMTIAYWLDTTTSAYSVKWYVQAQAVGEVATTLAWNILNGSTSYDFPSQTTRELHFHKVTLTGISAGDRIGVYLQSDANNTSTLRIFDIWLSPNSDADDY